MTTDNHKSDGQGVGVMPHPPRDVGDAALPKAATGFGHDRPEGGVLGAIPPATGQLTDALAAWRAEAGAAPVGLEEVRLDQNERLLVPFTTSMARTTVHYLDFASQRGYVRCNGKGCLLCRVGRKADLRDLLPVYDVIAKSVGVLAVPLNIRPQALKPQLIPAIARVAANERLLLAIRKIDGYRFTVAALPLPEEADDGAERIAEFLERLESGSADLTTVYVQLSNDELAALPEVAILVKARGIKL
jgi:hypothetical protein